MKPEPVGLLSKYFIVQYRESIRRLFKENPKPITLFFILLFVLFLNAIFLIIHPLDYKKLSETLEFEEPSTLYAINRKGEYEPIAEYTKFSRIVLRLKDLPQENPPISKDKRNRIIQCFISTEDNEFYSHYGVDPKGIFRALVVNLLSGRIKEGASTITQQVARLKFLNQERTIARKAREAWIAFLLEIVHTKDAIMESYLNEIPLGHGTIGVGAASRFYFRKDAKDLTWGEAALLASLTTRPSKFSPLVNPKESMAKVRVVFRRLVENGRMDVATAEKEYNQFLEFYRQLNRSPNDSAFADRLNRFPYVTEYLRRLLVNTVGSATLYHGGLKIYSSIHIQHQEEAEKALYSALKKQTLESNQRSFRNIDIFDEQYGNIIQLLTDIHDLNEFKFKVPRSLRKFNSHFQEELRDELAILNLLSGSDQIGAVLETNYLTQSKQDFLLPVEGSLISIRPFTGHITAIVGGSGFRTDNQQIRPFQAFRQPGSSFKPVIYAAILDYYAQNPNPEKNITASSLFLDSPLAYLLEDGDEWTPENFSNEYSGFILLREALELSKNSVAVRALEHVGLSNILPKIHELTQVKRPLPPNYSISLGSFELTPLELTRIYATFASRGKSIHPKTLLWIENKKGEIIKDFREDSESKEKQIILPETAYIITSMMEGVIQRGTGKAALSYGLTRPAAGKTGTTNNFRDAWFVGYTPELVASVWMGYDVGTISLGRGVTGGKIAAPVWGRFMQNALLYEPKSQFSDEGLNIVRRQICKSCGKLPGPHCKETREEIFHETTVPKEYCDDPRGLDIDSPSPTYLYRDRQGPVASPARPPQSKPSIKNKNIFQGDDEVSF